MSDSDKIPVNMVADIASYKRLFAELMHSFAIKCDCSVIYNEETNQIIYKGPKKDVDYVINETAKLLDVPPHKFKRIIIK